MQMPKSLIKTKTKTKLLPDPTLRRQYEAIFQQPAAFARSAQKNILTPNCGTQHIGLATLKKNWPQMQFREMLYVIWLELQFLVFQIATDFRFDSVVEYYVCS